MHLRPMLAAHPDVRGSVAERLLKAIEESLGCAAHCTSCADACLAEGMVADLRQCIRTCLDCADLCFAFASVGLRRAGSNVPVLLAALRACEAACAACAAECERHASMHEHCRLCAEACRACEAACREAVADLR